MAGVPLIAWENVPEGPVWFRPQGSGGNHWYCGLREWATLHDAVGRPVDHREMEFAAAEQQPGDYARVVAELARLKAERPSSHSDEAIARQQAEAELDRLRDGLAALEQDMYGTDWFHLEPADAREWLDRLTSLRTGQRGRD